MLKFRVIPVVLIDGPNVVKGSKFDNWRRVGTLTPILNVHNTRDVDELILIDSRASRLRETFDFRIVESAIRRLSAPLSVGGGVSSVDAVSRLVDSGADKVIIGTAAASSPALLERAANRFGSQAVIASVDVSIDSDGNHSCFAVGGSERLEADPVELALRYQDSGAGEIVLNSIDRDGTMSGFDLEIVSMIAESISIPLIAAGGAGSLQDFVDLATSTKSSAAAAGSVFLFSQITPQDVRVRLASAGVASRVVHG